MSRELNMNELQRIQQEINHHRREIARLEALAEQLKNSPNADKQLLVEA